MRVSLKDFALTGDFGPVKVGFTPANLVAAFGEAEATCGTLQSPVIWKYGNIEFHFGWPDGELCLIHLDRFSAATGCPQGWGKVRIEPWVIRVGLPREKFVATIAEARLSYSVRPEPLFNQEVVELASGVEVGFICRPEPYSPPVGLAWLSRRVVPAGPTAPAEGRCE